MQPHHHGGEGHLALHAVLADGVDDSRREVDVQVAEEDDAVRVLGTEAGWVASPLDQRPEARPLPGPVLQPLRISGRNVRVCWAHLHGAGPQGTALPMRVSADPSPPPSTGSEDTFSAVCVVPPGDGPAA